MKKLRELLSIVKVKITALFQKLRTWLTILGKKIGESAAFRKLCEKFAAMDKRYKLALGVFLGLLVLIVILCSVIVVVKKREPAETESRYTEAAANVEEIHKIFPKSYWEALDALSEAHPTWKFTALLTNYDWEDCFVRGEDTEMYPTRNLVSWDGDFSGGTYYDKPSSWYSTDLDGAFSWEENAYVIASAPDFVQVSEEAIRYCMDPRNFLTDEMIFMFEDQASCQGITLEEVQAVFERVTDNSVWTRNAQETGIISRGSMFKGQRVTYAEAVYEIGMDLQINPVILASRIVQEQGYGKSPLIGGTYVFTMEDTPDSFHGYYNYFNMEATEFGGTASKEKIIINGLREAYRERWDTRYKALYGGAEKFKQKFIERYQPTYYLQKFNIDNRSNGLFWRQYMQAILAPQSESKTTYSSYVKNETLELERSFIIPVFNNMPEEPCKEPTGDGNPNNRLASIKVDRETIPEYDAGVFTYNIEVTEDVETVELELQAFSDTTEIRIEDKEERKELTQEISLKKKETEIVISCTAENGAVQEYILHIIKKNETKK